MVLSGYGNLKLSTLIFKATYKQPSISPGIISQDSMSALHTLYPWATVFSHPIEVEFSV